MQSVGSIVGQASSIKKLKKDVEGSWERERECSVEGIKKSINIRRVNWEVRKIIK